MDLDHASMINDRSAGWLDRLAWQRWKSGGRSFVVVCWKPNATWIAAATAASLEELSK